MVENNTDGQEILDNIESHVPTQLHPILEAVFKHQKQVVIGVSAVILVAAVYTGMTIYNQHAMKTAQAKLGTILIEAAGDEKLSQLQDLLNAAPSGAHPAILLELAQSCMKNEQYEKSSQYWDQLAKASDDDLQIVARLGKAKTLTLAGKGAEAVPILQDIAEAASTEFTISVNRQLAIAAEQAGETDVALKAYQKLAEQPIADKPFIQFKIAELEAK
ncbi:YfgM family protein [Pseudodesulfovibrio piezophilus]|uniref:Tetratricopeptide repeat-like domain-containing protein n=1 Tax=Pseudodesulfovibrio piezophilus (strain DSM 21447 / JCM 15486 / C1TLV30) TaxID=1322246 RepID=M1WJN6_PSEP2|nr:hypothetical protein [Pseudodesulfovibrio piezophilus]CCH48211.1 conserved protein of unknown function [Pseudodesulfovibrio piezophilus C1TLV30]